MNRDERRRAGAVHEQLAHAVPGRFRRDHGHVHVGARCDAAEADVESVGEQQQLAWREVRRDGITVHLRLRRVGHEHHDDVGPGGDAGDVADVEAGRGRLRAGAAGGVEADAHVHSAVAQVQRMRVALRSVADDADLLRSHDRQIRIFVVIHRRHHVSLNGEFVNW